MRLLCLFIVDILNSPSFALTQWFDYKKEPEWIFNMYVVTKSEKYKVIEISTIEWEVYLIPEFGKIGTTYFPLNL